ncbi:MAG: 2-C-methyl-D-erythritol 2,4-cyclodiphosphate synthase [Candidatus Auribacter fodinae]|jgi:2-C-methyl-D-erythritol 2,4-cyclodiphosphate synthase|uniref:2-C-methyl-D-erythritol 2,4-cyclodiphosphate synthase n=1 Tax=Candidatus Auribacter fodinae TaxID=2093366 RepID=A0A3A4QQX0_9BACT|nr:MAG: 2-C-methyl-D-erythritol 2,4-cyclodiphosphate synthase [Candidatus Auribacter fodinae]
MRVGFGCDIHPFDETKKLYLGGVYIPGAIGLKGHSDADVVLHAVCDSLLGAAALGDIGEHFPDTNAVYKDRRSTFFLETVVNLLHDKGFMVNNIDIMILAEKPKVNAYKQEMREIVAQLCHITPSCIGVKATTAEQMGFVGRGEGIVAYAVSTIKLLEV